MNKQEGMEIVERLRRAAKAGAPVMELVGDDAKNFAFVRDRSIVLGSFGVEVGKKFFVSIASSSRNVDAFQILLYEKLKGNPVLASSYVGSGGIVWTYQAAKQTGDNQARKKAFLDAALTPSLIIPLPDNDVTAFSNAVNRAIELRRMADAAGGTDSDDDDDRDTADILDRLFSTETDRVAAARSLANSIRLAHSINPKSWCITNPAGAALARLNVGVVRVVDLIPGAVKLAVDASKLDSAVRVALGSALHFDEERIPSFEDNGAVIVKPSEVATLPEAVWTAHEAFVRRAAPTVSPFARYHQPEIVDAVSAIVGEALPVPASAQNRFWKVSPGENAEMWEECRNGGFIAIGWDKLGDLSNVDHDEFKKRAEALDASDQVWKFRNIEVGDRIVANNGISRVLGIGTVTGPYYFVPGKRRGHRLQVHWDDTNERVVDMRGWRGTLIRLKQDTFKQIEAAPLVDSTIGANQASARGPLRRADDEAGPEGGIDFDGILSELIRKSLSFSAELVASYLLALQAKRFVLLTGISGTGKTKLAQEVARVFDDSGPDEPSADAETLTLDAKPYHRKYSRFIVPSRLAQEFDVLSDPTGKQLDLQVPGLPRATVTIGRRVDSTSFMEVLLSGAVREWFMANVQIGDRFALSRRVEGDDEWLELRLPERGSQRARPTGASAELIAVRPDWTDKSSILGFYNPLIKEYVSTPILRLLLRARDEVVAAVDSAPRPYFLIFDEMNLARVEHYFSDFLSAMESGDAIHLHEDLQVEELTGIPRRLSLPKNLFVVGTVNVDETTYMFSPKVLDRAFVLEFNDVNLDGLAGTIKAEEASSTPLALTRMEGGLKLRGVADDAEWLRFEKVLGGEASALLRKLHAALATENRHFGYRVAREIARFVDFAMEQTDGSDSAAWAALDVAVFSKVLPKLHGSQAEIEQVLTLLLAIAIGNGVETEVFSTDGTIVEARKAAVPLPRTARKLWRMKRRLRANGFVSFIE